MTGDYNETRTAGTCALVWQKVPSVFLCVVPSSYLTVDLRVHTLHICTLQLVYPGKTQVSVVNFSHETRCQTSRMTMTNSLTAGERRIQCTPPSHDH